MVESVRCTNIQTSGIFSVLLIPLLLTFHTLGVDYI